MPAVATAADCLRVYDSAGTTEAKHLAVVGTIPGVVPLAAAGKNGPGTARLRSYDDGTRIAWRAPGSNTYGVAVPVPADGAYLLEDGGDRNKFLRVQVYTAHLVGPTEGRVLLGDRFNNIPAGADFTAGQASAGATVKVELTLKNESALTITQIVAWLDAATDDPPTWAISDDDVSYVSPTTEGTGLKLDDMAPASTQTLYTRKVVAASTSSVADALEHLHLAFNGL